MPDREKVIKELRYIRTWAACGAIQVTDCERIQNALDDALELLKAHEPRVMTPEEYAAWVDTPFTERDPVLCERKNKRGSILCWDNLPVCSVEDYGNDVRCWTSRPTDKQRRAVKWE